jgi:hypothetical protein
MSLESHSSWLVDQMGTKLLNNPFKNKRASSYSFLPYDLFIVNASYKISDFDLNNRYNHVQILKISQTKS